MENIKLVKAGIDFIGTGGGVLILNGKKQILLMERAGKVKNEVGFWSKPGGTIKFGEQVELAMKRELKEELDIDIKITGLLPYTDHFTKDETGAEHWLAINFIGKIVNGYPRNMEPEKCSEIGWFDLDNLPKKITQTTEESIKNYLEDRFILL